MRILLAQINPIIGDIQGNTEKILKGISHAKKQHADLVLFSELCLSGYPPQDLLELPHFLSALITPLETIQKASKDITVIVGTPRVDNTSRNVYNSAAIFVDGKIVGYQDKFLLPTYDVFYERRYFVPGSERRLWNLCGKRIAITICEDIWQHSGKLTTSYPQDPVNELQQLNPDLVLNLSASPYSLDKVTSRIEVCAITASSLKCPLLLCNQVGGNDGLIFDGHSVFVNAEGQLLQCGKGFEEEMMLVNLEEQRSPITLTEDPMESLYKALCLGLHDYFDKLGLNKACLGLSGGIDSALVACIAVDALGKENVLAINMPSRFSSEGSVADSEQLVKNLEIELRSIPIESPFASYLDLLAPQFVGKEPDVTEENLQARIRGMILMALSNKFGYIVLSTGNKSELAMGYSTLYGDMCGGLAVISDLTKKQVYALAKWINRNREIIPWNTIKKPPSAELRPNQKDSDSLPDYDIVDNVLEAYVEQHQSPQEIATLFNYSLDLVNDLVKRIHRNEYKRRQNPPGLRVTEKSFSTGRHFPIVHRF
ncbi:MAG: NAD+ synthase [Parachlamydiaceae bacterium]|nr:NAD+ synthase [Parachlamydiaceae bacterium]